MTSTKYSVEGPGASRRRATAGKGRTEGMRPAEGPVVYKHRVDAPRKRLLGLTMAACLLGSATVGTVAGTVAALGKIAPQRETAFVMTAFAPVDSMPPAEGDVAPVRSGDGRVGLPPPSSSGASTAKATAVVDLKLAALGEADRVAAFRAHRPAARPTGGASVAIVIDDLGLNPARTDKVIALKGPLTLSFLPYGGLVRPLARQAKAAGHEVMLHLPMEPLGNEDPGPHALLVRQTPEQLLAQLDWALDRFDGYVGINNHMGSRFTENVDALRVVMEGLKGRHLFFLDSQTSQHSRAFEVALAAHIPALKRDVFIDHEIDPVKIAAQIAIFEDVARRTGSAIAIAHPHEETMAALAQWLETAEARGFKLVPASEILAIRAGRSGQIAVALPDTATSME